MLEEIQLGENAEFMTLGQLLKLTGLIGTGGQAKWFLEENSVFVNGEAENRRGRKLVAGDEVIIDGQGSYIISKR